ncbi:MAG: site-2 protease family protein [Nitrospirae bacterium]|nr:site-2 protease family protein [Nitrospirota bacterium]
MHVPSWEIGRALGIPIRVHASWFLVFLLVTWTLSTGYLPESLPGLSPERYWAMGGIGAVLLFLSVLLHELGHSYVALRYRIPIDQITLFIFGGVAHMRKEAPTPRAEFLIAVAGPAVSFTLGAVCLGFVILAESLQQQHALQGPIILGALLGMVNVQLGLFNLIPGFPLDGGRVLRAGLWAWGKDFYRATKQAAVVGLGFGVVLGLLGVVVIFGALNGALPTSTVSNGGWVIFIGMFLFAAALASRRQAALRQSLATVPVRDLMVRKVTSIPSNCTLEEAVNQYFQSHGYGGFPVLEDAQLVGLVTVFEIQTVPPTLWPWRRVGQVMRPLEFIEKLECVSCQAAFVSGR